jgi:hypothetical protein
MRTPRQRNPLIDKSFLVLFFKKERFDSVPLAAASEAKATGPHLMRYLW